jgi:hypothetical protein
VVALLRILNLYCRLLKIKSHAFSLHSARVGSCDLSLGLVYTGHCALLALALWSARKPGSGLSLGSPKVRPHKLGVAAPERLDMVAVWLISFADAQSDQ